MPQFVEIKSLGGRVATLSDDGEELSGMSNREFPDYVAQSATDDDDDDERAPRVCKTCSCRCFVAPSKVKLSIARTRLFSVYTGVERNRSDAPQFSGKTRPFEPPGFRERRIVSHFPQVTAMLFRKHARAQRCAKGLSYSRFTRPPHVAGQFCETQCGGRTLHVSRDVAGRPHGQKRK